jgi:hypothetical protein
MLKKLSGRFDSFIIPAALMDGYRQGIVKESLDKYFDAALLVRSRQEVKKGNSGASLPISS